MTCKPVLVCCGLWLEWVPFDLDGPWNTLCPRCRREFCYVEPTFIENPIEFLRGPVDKEQKSLDHPRELEGEDDSEVDE